MTCRTIWGRSPISLACPARARLRVLAALDAAPFDLVFAGGTAPVATDERTDRRGAGGDRD